MTFLFDSDVAKIAGTNSAVLFQNIAFWVDKNRANNKHLHDGRYWTYNSNQAFVDLFPFLSRQQIRTALDKLQESGLIETGEYNEIPFDKTKWYTLTDRGWEMYRKQPSDLLKSTNTLVESNQPIPYINTDIKPKNKSLAPSLAEVREYIKAQGYHFSPDEFFNYYDASGWHKANGKPVKNWKQCCVTWESTWKQSNPQRAQDNGRKKKLI